MFLFLLISVIIIAISRTTTVTAEITSVAKDGNQDMTTEYIKQTPWPGFIPCQFYENSTYFCPKKRPKHVGSCSSPPAPNDYYCTEEGYCQCDYNYDFVIIIIVSCLILGLAFIICCIWCICCLCKKLRRDRNVERTKAYKGLI